MARWSDAIVEHVKENEHRHINKAKKGNLK